MEKYKYRITLDDVETAPVDEKDGWEKIDFRIMINDEICGSELVCWWRTIFPKGRSHHKHLHTDAEEVVFGLSGRGASGFGDGKELEITPNTAIYIPRNVVHWTRNLSEDEDLIITGAYIGAPNLEKTGYKSLGEITEEDKVL